MAQTTIIPLEQLNVAQKLAEIRSIQSQANRYSTIGGAKLPGIPDIPKMIWQMLKDMYQNLLKQGREEVRKLIEMAIAMAMQQTAVLIPAINSIIRVINRLVRTVNRVIDALFPIVKSIFYVITALSVVYVVSKVISKIPAPFVGMGSGIAFTGFIGVCQDIMNGVDVVLADIHPIGFAIISVMLLLIQWYNYIRMVIGWITARIFQQQNIQKETTDILSNSADDWDNKGGDAESGGDVDQAGLVECTLIDGSVQQLTPQDCINIGGVFPGMDMLSGLNDLNKRINELTDELANIGAMTIVHCLLPNGSVEQMTHQECLSAGGVSLTEDELKRLIADRDNLLRELGRLSGVQLDENIITSLIHPHDDVTVEKAVKNKGKRYGFYQSYRRIKNED